MKQTAIKVSNVLQ